MMRTLILLLIPILFTACAGSGGGGGAPANPNDGQTPQSGSVGEFDNDTSCIIREPSTQVYYAGFGDSNQSAAELAVELCRNLAPASANCQQAAICEPRAATDQWRCTVRNIATGDVWTDIGKSRVETFSFMHGICSAGIHGSPQVCQSFEQASCTRNASLSID